MPRKPSPAVRTTLYRLTGLAQLSDAIRNKYLESGNFGSSVTSVGGREALVVSGLMATERVKWAANLYGLTGEDVDIGNQTAAGVLLIRDGDDHAWALSYGMGFQLLDQNYFDAGFGQRIAIRVADPNELSSLTRATLDQRARVDRSSIPSGDHLRGFGFGELGELVTRFVGKARVPGLTDPAEFIKVRGADALSLPLGKRQDQLISDLDVLTGVLSRPVVPGLEPLEQLTMLKHDPGLVSTLDEYLEDAIESPEDKMIGLSWPHEQIDENGTPNAFHLSGVGRQAAGPHDDLPSLEQLLSVLRNSPPGQRVDRARRIKVSLLGDDDGEQSIPLSRAIPVRKWLAFETKHEGRRYFLHNGNWYLMDEDYAAKLRRQTKEILSVPAGFSMPDWPAGMVEADYNTMAATKLGGLLLDVKLLRTELHGHGIEVCDILLPDGTLVHVKKIRRSDAASHHIAQALVSADALSYDEEARKGFADLIVRQGGDPGWQSRHLRRVVLAMARPGVISEQTLMTFAQVTLARGIAPLRARGIEVCILPITLLK